MAIAARHARSSHRSLEKSGVAAQLYRPHAQRLQGEDQFWSKGEENANHRRRHQTNRRSSGSILGARSPRRGLGKNAKDSAISDFESSVRGFLCVSQHTSTRAPAGKPETSREGARARRVLTTRRPESLSFDTSGVSDRVFGSGVGCVGRIETLLLPLPAESDAHLLALLERATSDRRTLRRHSVANLAGAEITFCEGYRNQERVAVLQEVLERRTERSALLLRALLGKIRLEPVTPEGGRVYYRAISNLQVLALLDVGTTPEDPGPGSTSLKWWRRRELNPRPEASRERPLHAQPLLGSRPRASRRGKTARGHPRIRFAATSGDPARLHPHLATPFGARRVRSPKGVATIG